MESGKVIGRLSTIRRVGGAAHEFPDQPRSGCRAKMRSDGDRPNALTVASPFGEQIAGGLGPLLVSGGEANAVGQRG